jgi:predicted acetyltransferase
MTEIRRLTAGDMPQLARMRTVVYNGRRDFSKEEKNAPDPLANPPEWSWGAFENGKLYSGMTEIEYLMRFDGHSVPMSGISGVGTLPEARKGGLVREIFKKLLPEAYERGVVFSNLTPFSHAFYRKFGYETACARNNITIPAREFSHLRPKGSFTQIFPGDNTSALNEIHRSYIADINHGICRDHWPENRAWKIFTKNDPYSTGIFLYLWRDDSGKARGYIKYQDIQKDDEHIMSVQELAFTDPEALYSVLSIVSGLSAQFKKFQWLMPAFLDPSDFVCSVWDIEQRIIPRDMTRIINVKTALEKIRRPEGEGEFVIEVYDDIIGANSGRYLVEYNADGNNVSFTKKKPHLRCDMLALSQLVTGYRPLGNILRAKQSGIEVHENRNILDKVFTPRPQHVTEYF